MTIDTLSHTSVSFLQTQKKNCGNGGREYECGNEPGDSSGNIPPRRWKTIEFYVYYCVLFCALIKTIYLAVEVSNYDSQNFPIFRHRLSPGWIFGRLVDNSDLQFRFFRNNIFLLSLVMLGFVVIGRVFTWAYVTWKLRSYSLLSQKTSELLSTPHSTDSPYHHVDRLYSKAKRIYTFSASLIVGYLYHGNNLLLVLGLLMLNFWIGTTFAGSRINPLLTWCLSVTLLLGCEWFRGFRFSSYLPQSSYFELLDCNYGAIVNWFVFFNMSVLRMISFNLDYYFSFQEKKESALVNKHLDKCSECKTLELGTDLSVKVKEETGEGSSSSRSSNSNEGRRYACEKYRCLVSPSSSEFSLVNYIGYALYPPLYLSGPILTFNNYVFQMERVSHHHHHQTLLLADWKGVILYGLRLLVSLLVMELVLHYIYVVAMKEEPATLLRLSFGQIIVYGYWNLKLIWLKLLIIWRFARFWSLLDGLEAPENMVRCMSNNYSGLAFWRSWHRSYNLWILRYIYIPLGGRKTALWNIWIVFTFVALWHDRTFKLLVWGWLVCLFILPEVILRWISKAYQMHHWKGYRFLAGFWASLNVFFMSAANLVGFAVGLEGMKDMLKRYEWSWTDMSFILVAFFIVFAVVQIMFELREEEKRRGIHLNC